MLCRKSTVTAWLAAASLVACTTANTRAGEDAVAIHDAGVSDVLYWQWWYPDCGVPPGGACTNPQCAQTTLAASAVGGCSYAGPGFLTGCVPGNQGEDGYINFSSDDHIFIGAFNPPYTQTGLSPCQVQGHPGNQDMPLWCCPWITDAGGD
jgi:hypothetical protein